jgi:hypothetical protein
MIILVLMNNRCKVLVVLIASKLFVHGQQIASHQKDELGLESYFNIKDSTIKYELSTFVRVSTVKLNNLSKSSLTNITAKRGYENSIYFSEENWKSISLSIEIIIGAIDSNKVRFRYLESDSSKCKDPKNKLCYGVINSMPTSEIKKIIVSFHKARTNLPDSAFDGIFEPSLYHLVYDKKSVSCKVFRSLDCKRIYIYMLNSSCEKPYEVTWILNNGKYTGRVIDYIAEF